MSLVMVSAALGLPVEIEAPERAWKGEPFVVTVSSSKPMLSAMATWLDREVPAMIIKEGGVHKALFLLGTDVKRSYRQIEPLAVHAVVDGEQMAHSKPIEIYEKNFPVQKLSVDPNMVVPPKEFLPRIREEGRVVGEALSTLTVERLWSLPMQRPVKGRISSIYGLRRVFNGQPRTPHRGLDISAPTGEPVRSVDNGRVILIGDHYYAGQSVYLDHGQGVISAYFHLSKIVVRTGQVVPKGEFIGHVGSTGRVTGPHLHFGLYVLGQAVDPEPLLLEEGVDEVG